MCGLIDVPGVPAERLQMRRTWILLGLWDKVHVSCLSYSMQFRTIRFGSLGVCAR